MIRLERAAVSRAFPAFSRAFSQGSPRYRQLLPTTNSPIVSKLDFFNSVQGNEQIPTYRVLDGVGKPLEGAELPEVWILHGRLPELTRKLQIDRDFARRLYENMQLLPTLDNVLYNVQRQGKISFYVCFRILVYNPTYLNFKIDPR